MVSMFFKQGASISYTYQKNCQQYHLLKIAWKINRELGGDKMIIVGEMPQTCIKIFFPFLPPPYHLNHYNYSNPEA